jgi:hypothetical protein
MHSLSVVGVRVSLTRVVVLTTHSMFTEGIASRLRSHPDQIDVRVIDGQEVDCLERIREAHPSVILLEANDESINKQCSLSQLLEAAPEVKVIQLDRDNDQIHVITGEYRIMRRPTDLISLLLPTNPGEVVGPGPDPKML